MDVFHVNSTSLNNSYDYSNTTSNYYNYSNTTSNYYNYSNTTSNYYNYRNTIIHVTICIIIIIGLPLTLVAIYSLYSLVRKDHVAPIYVINLLISDLIQLCCMIVQVAPTDNVIIYTILGVMYFYCVMVSVGFMVCIALERYLVIAHPLWYRYRRTIKISVLVCVLVWTLPALCGVIAYNIGIFFTFFGIFFFLPLPLFIFFLGGTLKVLSATRVPSDEKRRIVGVLVLVLLIYTLLFLPTIIIFLSEGNVDNIAFSALSLIFVRLSPLADLTLYVFMKKGIIDKLLSSVCCCRMDRMDGNDTNSSSV
ncbi:uncharacterized protein ABDE67_014002 [Symphorus nematophorus]